MKIQVIRSTFHKGALLEKSKKVHELPDEEALILVRAGKAVSLAPAEAKALEAEAKKGEGKPAKDGEGTPPPPPPPGA